MALPSQTLRSQDVRLQVDNTSGDLVEISGSLTDISTSFSVVKREATSLKSDITQTLNSNTDIKVSISGYVTVIILPIFATWALAVDTEREVLYRPSSTAPGFRGQARLNSYSTSGRNSATQTFTAEIQMLDARLA